MCVTGRLLSRSSSRSPAPMLQQFCWGSGIRPCQQSAGPRLPHAGCLTMLIRTGCAQGLDAKQIARAGSAMDTSQAVSGGARRVANATDTTCLRMESASSLPCANNRQVHSWKRMQVLACVPNMPAAYRRCSEHALEADKVTFLAVKRCKVDNHGHPWTSLCRWIKTMSQMQGHQHLTVLRVHKLQLRVWEALPAWSLNPQQSHSSSPPLHPARYDYLTEHSRKSTASGLDTSALQPYCLCFARQSTLMLESTVLSAQS